MSMEVVVLPRLCNASYPSCAERQLGARIAVERAHALSEPFSGGSCGAACQCDNATSFEVVFLSTPHPSPHRPQGMIKLVNTYIDVPRSRTLAEALSAGLLPHLEELDISGAGLGPYGSRAISDALRTSALPRLRRFRVGFNRLGRDGVSNVAAALQAGVAPLLDVLDLSGNDLGEFGTTALAQALPALPQLLHLNLSVCSLGAGVRALVDALRGGAIPRLELLDLGGSALGDSGLVALTGAVRAGALPRLQQLLLGSNGIGLVGIRSLADALCSGDLPRLSKLSLRSNELHDDGALALAGAIGHAGAAPMLSHVDVVKNRISASGRDALVAVQLAATPPGRLVIALSTLLSA